MPHVIEVRSVYGQEIRDLRHSYFPATRIHRTSLQYVYSRIYPGGEKAAGLDVEPVRLPKLRAVSFYYVPLY